MLIFELINGLKKNWEKNVFHLVAVVGQRENSESSGGSKSQTFGFCALTLYL